jgi:hypothetical protein
MNLFVSANSQGAFLVYLCTVLLSVDVPVRPMCLCSPRAVVGGTACRHVTELYTPLPASSP